MTYPELIDFTRTYQREAAMPEPERITTPTRNEIIMELAQLSGQAGHAWRAYAGGHTVEARNHLCYVQERAAKLVQMICDEVPS